MTPKIEILPECLELKKIIKAYKSAKKRIEHTRLIYNSINFNELNASEQKELMENHNNTLLWDAETDILFLPIIKSMLSQTDLLKQFLFCEEITADKKLWERIKN